jgi:hypothetical protein
MVFTQTNEKGEVEPAEYGGVDVGVDGFQYPVKRDGSLSVVELPDHLAPRLAAHGFITQGKIDEVMVDRAAKDAMAELHARQEAEKAQAAMDRADAKAAKAARSEK